MNITKNTTLLKKTTSKSTDLFLFLMDHIRKKLISMLYIGFFAQPSDECWHKRKNSKKVFFFLNFLSTFKNKVKRK